ncbi:SMI1/KNR4 family protein [Microbulbifer sp. OS29]|uniref:SMI1/KNR4 family protein n=1 Tax=Microbulbifer okhotskensis TaxID=2926617 RepID=A0A9X2J6X1_9GAMM|nr:SMI1/KNR4 family protein [Microbulbifer okhotskensis]MCO1336673.1 SMI1/KNR4 family protein [Microbulbifer okhotskensis]
MELEQFIAVIKKDEGRASTEEELAEFEQVLGSSLPGDIREFLKICGGGQIFETPVKYLDQCGAEIIPRRMYNLNTIRCAFENPIDNWAPRELLPIGLDEGGNTLMLSLRPDRFGHIYLLDHECIYYPGSDEVPDEIETIEEAEEYRISYYSPSFGKFIKDTRLVEIT